MLSDDTRRQLFDHGGEDELDRFERGQGRQNKGPNARADISVTLEELYKGSDRSVNINRNVYCT